MFIILYFEKLINPLTKLDIDFYFLDYKKDIKSLRALTYYHIKDFMQSEYKRSTLIGISLLLKDVNNALTLSIE